MKTRDRIIALSEGGLANTEIAQIVAVRRQRAWSDDSSIFSTLYMVSGIYGDRRLAGC